MTNLNKKYLLAYDAIIASQFVTAADAIYQFCKYMLKDPEVEVVNSCIDENDKIFVSLSQFHFLGFMSHTVTVAYNNDLGAIYKVELGLVRTHEQEDMKNWYYKVETRVVGITRLSRGSSTPEVIEI